MRNQGRKFSSLITKSDHSLMQKALGAWAEFRDNYNFEVTRKQIAQELEELWDKYYIFGYSGRMTAQKHCACAGAEEAVSHRRWYWNGCIHICRSLELAVSIWNWGGRRGIVMKMSEEPKNRSDLQAKYEKFQVKNYK